VSEGGREAATCFFLIVFSTFLCRSSKKRILKGKNKIQKTNFNLNFLFPRNGRSNWAKLKNVIYWLLSLFCYRKKWPMRIIKGKWCFWANLNNIVSNMKRKKMYCTYTCLWVLCNLIYACKAWRETKQRKIVPKAKAPNQFDQLTKIVSIGFHEYLVHFQIICTY
jgi:hypothetical protein